MTDDERWMRRALELAARGLGETNPNPPVGCVIVRGRRVVGEGWHRRAGSPHAEAEALAAAGPRARGATAYVTLEPCAHHGRTPPCADALVAAGLAQVAAATPDPNPRVKGGGLAVLRRAGVSTSVGLLEAEARRLAEPFLGASRRGRPFVTLKVATTLDGRIATAGGHSRWVTSPRQRAEGRRLRRLHDGIAVGIGTVLADDPLLLPSPRVRRPFHRVVLDARLRLPEGSRLVRTARLAPVWAFCTEEAWRLRGERLEALGVRVRPVPPAEAGVRLGAVLDVLWAQGVWSLMVEGGSEVLGSFLAERLLDKLLLFRAPLLLGGRGSRPAFGGPDPLLLSDALRLVPGALPATPTAADPDPALAEVWYPVTSGPSRRP